MACWLTMSLSQVSGSRILVEVDVNWDYPHFNRDGGELNVTVDGVGDTRNPIKAPFNTEKTDAGSQNIYSQHWNISQPNGAAKTVYASATFKATSNTTATPASATLNLPTTGSSGGSSGGGDSGDSGDSGDDSGGGGSGDSGGGSDACYDVISDLTHASMTVSLKSGNIIAGQYKAGSVIKIVVTPDDGYRLTSCYINGESKTSATISVNGDIYVEAVAELDDDDGDDGGDSGGDEGGSGGDTGYTESKNFWIFEGEGTKVTIEKWEGTAANGGYVEVNLSQYLTDGPDDWQGDSGVWYKFDVYNNEFFTIDATALSGYTINTTEYADSEGDVTLNFGISGLHYHLSYNEWSFETRDEVDAYVYATATESTQNKFVVCIHNDSTFDEYELYINNGVTWDEYEIYIHDDTSWFPN